MKRDGGQLAHSWEANAGAWTAAVRQGEIPSRRLGTDAAIVNAIRERRPRRVLDVGCGEGWLARTLAAHDIHVTGIDASSPLIESARAAGGGTFHVCSFAALPAKVGLFDEKFDAAVCNFALLEEDVAPVLLTLGSLLAPAGILFVQTVHPWIARGDGAYRDGWRTEDFSGFGSGFSQPMPWYFRTLASWIAVLRSAGFRIEELREPGHPETGEPLSLLLVAHIDS